MAIILRRRRAEEGKMFADPAFWWDNGSLDYVVSVFIQPKNVEMRIGSPQGHKKIGFPFAAKTEGDAIYLREKKDTEKRFAKAAEMYYKRIFGIDVRVLTSKEHNVNLKQDRSIKAKHIRKSWQPTWRGDLKGSRI